MFSKSCLIVALTFATSAFAQGAANCDAQAAEKKLSGAAKTSFLKKCKEDAATAQCDIQAKEKNLAGAAKTSFTNKCVKDAAAAQ
jgi:hypothetical protein